MKKVISRLQWYLYPLCAFGAGFGIGDSWLVQPYDLIEGALWLAMLIWYGLDVLNTIMLDESNEMIDKLFKHIDAYRGYTMKLEDIIRSTSTKENDNE